MLFQFWNAPEKGGRPSFFARNSVENEVRVRFRVRKVVGLRSSEPPSHSFSISYEPVGDLSDKPCEIFTLRSLAAGAPMLLLSMVRGNARARAEADIGDAVSALDPKQTDVTRGNLAAP